MDKTDSMKYFGIIAALFSLLLLICAAALLYRYVVLKRRARTALSDPETGILTEAGLLAKGKKLFPENSTLLALVSMRYQGLPRVRGDFGTEVCSRVLSRLCGVLSAQLDHDALVTE